MTYHMLTSPDWQDYELLDSGDSAKLERFGDYTFIRPEPQAMWTPALPQKHWEDAHAVFHGSGDDDEGGNQRWEFRQRVPSRWQMRYRDLKFYVETTPFRHMGVFPEHASQWDWMTNQVRHSNRPINALNLFGYTGLASLALAQAGASVTHVDASKKAIAWARENQTLAGLQDRPIRWLTEDALKYVRREQRRGTRYDAMVIDPPKFGRGPQGEIWKLAEALPELLSVCKSILSDYPLFIVLTTYAVRVSSYSLQHLLVQMTDGRAGTIELGEMGAQESSAGRILAIANFARWSKS